MDISIINCSRNGYASSKELSILSYFLIDDIGARTTDSLVNWLQDDKYESAVLNYSYIKKCNDKVRIYCFHDGYEREEAVDRKKFETTKSQLIEIAQKWQELYEATYTVVKIVKAGDNVSLTGRRKRCS